MTVGRSYIAVRSCSGRFGRHLHCTKVGQDTRISKLSAASNPSRIWTPNPLGAINPGSLTRSNPGRLTRKLKGHENGNVSTEVWILGLGSPSNAFEEAVGLGKDWCVGWDFGFVCRVLGVGYPGLRKGGLKGKENTQD